MSTLAGETARTMLLGFAMYSEMRFRVCFSMSVGWSPMGTCVARVSRRRRGGVRRRHLSQARQVDQCQVEDVWRVDLEVDCLPGNALVAAGNPRRLVLDLALHVGEVVKPPVGDMVKLGPFGALGGAGVPVSVVDRARIALFLGNVDELENQGPPRDNTTAAGQEVPSHDVFQHGRLSGGLGADNHLGTAY